MTPSLRIGSRTIVLDRRIRSEELRRNRVRIQVQTRIRARVRLKVRVRVRVRVRVTVRVTIRIGLGLRTEESGTKGGRNTEESHGSMRYEKSTP